MGTSSGPNIIKNGIVLYLDASNEKSFKGEPTVNVVTNTNLDNGWAKGYNNSILWNDYPPPIGIDSNVVSFIPNSSNSYWYSYGDYAPQEPGVTYTISIWTRTYGSDFNIITYTADNSETGRYWSNSKLVKGDGKWYRVDWTFTNAINSQSDSLSFYFSNLLINQRYWLCAPQMEAKSYSTPFIDGIRGTDYDSNGGWVNLVDDNNHGELSNNLLYDNDGSLIFNGIDNYIQLNSLNMSRTSSTLLSWIYIDDFNTGKSNTGRVFIRLNGQNYRCLVTFYNGGYGFETDTNSNPHEMAGRTSAPISSSYIIPNSWFYFGLVFDSNTYYGYINGVQTGTALLSSDLPFDRIGDGNGFPDNYPGYFKGKISNFKLYDRPLISDEILKNYNMTKSKFGL